MWPRRGARSRGRWVWAAGASAAATFVFSLLHPAVAQTIDPSADQPVPQYGWREAWTGIDAARDQWLVFSGITVAPSSRDIYSDGLRLRFAGGYGQYGYDGWGPRPSCGDATQTDACTEKDRKRQHYTVGHDYAEALVGYHFRLGALTAKAFAGAATSSQRHFNKDPTNDRDGRVYGFKGAVELWLDINADSWTSVDVSYATTRDETSARWRSGWRVMPHFSIGPELRYDRNVETEGGVWDGRAGLFARYDWSGGEVSLAGGVAGRVDEWDATDLSPYGTLNVLFQF